MAIFSGESLVLINSLPVTLIIRITYLKVIVIVIRQSSLFSFCRGCIIGNKIDILFLHFLVIRLFYVFSKFVYTYIFYYVRYSKMIK